MVTHPVQSSPVFLFFLAYMRMRTAGPPMHYVYTVVSPWCHNAYSGVSYAVYVHSIVCHMREPLQRGLICAYTLCSKALVLTIRVILYLLLYSLLYIMLSVYA